MNDTDGLVFVMNSLRAGMDDERNKRIQAERIPWILSYQPIWKSDKVQRPEWDRRVGRIKLLPDNIVQDWRSILGNIDEIAAIGYLIDVDSLFTNNSFETVRSDRLKSRVKMLPRADVEALSDALKCSSAASSILLIQNDALFNGEQYRSTAFSSALADVKKATLTQAK